MWLPCSYNCCCDSPKVSAVLSWWGWDESLQSPGSFGCAQLHLMGLLGWRSGFECSDTVLTQHCQHMEGAQLSVWQEQAAAIQNIPTLNFVKKDTIEMLKAVIDGWWDSSVYTIFNSIKIKHCYVAFSPPRHAQVIMLFLLKFLKTGNLTFRTVIHKNRL